MKVAKDNDAYWSAKGDILACAYNNAYSGWSYRVASEGFEAVQKDCNDMAERMVKKYEDEVVRAERKNIADELEKYKTDILESRGIARPTWIGANELQKFIDGLRS